MAKNKPTKQVKEQKNRQLLLIGIVGLIVWGIVDISSGVGHLWDVIGKAAIVALILIGFFYQRGALKSKGYIQKGDLMNGILGLLLTWLGVASIYGELKSMAISNHALSSATNLSFLTSTIFVIVGSMVMGVAISRINIQIRNHGKN